jgi:hypothetical protein
VKVLPADFEARPEARARFLREARTAAKLEHPNVVQVYDVGEAGGVPYLIMQYVEGRGLDRVIRERGRIAAGEALSLAKRVASALDAASKLGVVHRDIKPANILISKDGLVKVADFGLAKEQDAGSSVSEPGNVLGTPHYMSPEQARGEAVDGRTDLYALGATLYHMLTGRRPYEGGNSPMAVVLRLLSPEEPPRPRSIEPSIPTAVEDLVVRLMAKDRAKRPASGEALIREIDALKAASAPIPPPQKRRAAVVALPIAGILAVGVILGLVLGGGKKPPPPPPKPAPAPAPKPVAVAPAPKPVPPPPSPPPAPPPPPPKETPLSRIRDATERRQLEAVGDRADALYRAIQKRDVDAVRGFLDRFTWGDLWEKAAAELVKPPGAEAPTLLSWELVEIELKPKQPARPLMAQTVHRFEMEHPQAKISMTGKPSLWVYRLTDQTWYLMRPKADGK